MFQSHCTAVKGRGKGNLKSVDAVEKGKKCAQYRESGENSDEVVRSS